MTHSDLRECQKEAIRIIRERRSSGEAETNISKCTGSGKSRVIREISQGNERRILVFPWLDLLTQYYDDHKEAYSSHACIRYFATEGTLSDVQRLSSDMKELDEKFYVIFTTYTSAPLIYSTLREVDLIVHDEAHRIERPEYAAAFSKISSLVKHTVNLSATLPSSKEAHYKYSLLRGIKDGVVRDFHMELFLCVDKERSETKLIETIVEKLKSLHSEAKLLIYTAEANTEGETASSVKTFMEAHAKKLREKGWWIEGIKDDTKDRKKVLREFEKHRDVSILVSCRTLSEGIDLKNANCMLPWDPSASVVTNIQRIGRVLRLYKTKKEQTPSTVLIPVFLNEEKYKECHGDKDKINEVLCKEISEGERGNFRPIVNVCTALKSELADDDPDLFNRLLDYPYEPKVEVNQDLVECVAKQCKKSSETVLEEIATALEGKVDEEQLEELKEGEWDEEINGQVVQALVETQGITLVVKDGDEVDMFGKGETVVTVEKKEEGYKVVKDKKEAISGKEAAQKRVAQRMRITFSDDCKILLGLESIEGAENTGGMVLTRLTTEVHLDEDWEKRRLEWVAIYEKLGRYAKQNSSDLIERRSAQWQHTQRRARKNKEKQMTLERISKLDETIGWKWEDEDTWKPNLEHWILQYKKLNRFPASSSKDLEEKKAGRWQTIQRKNYKCKEKSLTPQRIQILESTHGWLWEVDKFENSRLHWLKQYKRLNKNPSYASKDKEEKKAGSWQSTQRKLYKKKSTQMTPDRIKILESTPGWKWEDEDTWKPSLEHWISQYEIQKKSPSHSSKNIEERQAAIWQGNQRRNYIKKEKCMTPERIKILESTPGWSWSANEWEISLQNWITQFIRLCRSPIYHSDDNDEKKAGSWQSVQRRQYKEKNAVMTPDRIQILESTPGWTWGVEDSWNIRRQEWIVHYQRLERNPSYSSKDKDEKCAGNWQSQQRDNYKNKRTCMTRERIQILESTPGWTWSDKEDPKTPYVPHTTPTTQPRIRKHVKTKAESTGSGQQRQRSELEEYHKRFKTMNASTYKSSVTAEDFTAYHAIADTYDAKDPVERQPIHKIATLLSKYNKPSYSAIDLGCGKNRLRLHEAVSKMKWTSVDVHKVDDTVLIADMAALPFEEESYDFAILSRSLWARNHLDVMKETSRVLKSGGRAVICESFQRWMRESENELLRDLKATGFEIVYEEGTKIDDTVDDVFQYVVVRKP
jgi:superfamily II DNA or RNA helicase